MNYLIDSHFKKTSDGNIAYYPYSVFGHKGYIVPPKVESKIKYRFKNLWLTYYVVLFATGFVFIFLDNLSQVGFGIMAFGIPLIGLLANWRIQKSICKKLDTTDERLTLKEHAIAKFFPNREKVIWNIVGHLFFFGFFIVLCAFSKNPTEHFIRVGILMAYYFLVIFLF